MNYFQEYEARRNLYKNIQPGSIWRWNDSTDDDFRPWLRVIKVEYNKVDYNRVYYRYENHPDYPVPVYLQGTHHRDLNRFPLLASPFVPFIELAQ
jgi:hypothetical protein